MDYHDGVVPDLEPDIMEYEFKWALESITTTKASGRNRIPAELVQILKDTAFHSPPHPPQAQKQKVR